MSLRRKSISVSILDIKDAGTSAQKDYRTDFKSGKTDEMLSLSHAIHIDGRKSGTGRDVLTPKELPVNSTSFCYPVNGNDDCLGLGNQSGSILDYSSIGTSYRTQLFTRYTESALFYRTQNGDAGGSWNPWVRVFDTGNPPSPMDVGSDTRLWGNSDYPNGTLIKTSIYAGNETGDSFIIDILGKSYENSGVGSTSLNIVIEGYLYNNGFLNNSAIVHGGSFTGPITLLKLADGNLGIWFPRQGYWNNYGVIVYETRTAGYKKNLATEVIDSTKPDSTKTADITPQYTYGTYRKPTAADVGLGLVPNTQHSAAHVPNTVPVRDGNGDIHCRLVRCEYANQDVVSGALAFRVNNTTDNYIRFCSNPAAVRAWLSLDTGNTPTFAQSINTYSRAFRTVGAKFGTFWHNDGGDNLYLMFTNANDQYGSWSNLRPMQFNMNTGLALFSHGVSSSVGFHLPANVSLTFNASPNWAGGIGWGIQEEGATGNLMFHRYNSNVWQNAPLRIQNDSTLYCEGNGNFNDVYIRSDVRDKRKLKYIDNPLERIGKMCGAMYEVEDFHGWKQSVGLLAQHVKNGLPEAVSLDKNFKDQPRYRVNYNGVVGLLVNCVNVLDNKLKVLSNKFEKLNEAYNELAS